MISWKVKDDDIVLNELVEGKEEERQCIERTLTTCTNEWFLNTDFGLDYTKIRGKGVIDEQIRIAITQAILQEDRVREIIDIFIQRNNAKRTVEIKVVVKMKSSNVIEVVRGFE